MAIIKESGNESIERTRKDRNVFLRLTHKYAVYARNKAILIRNTYCAVKTIRKFIYIVL